MSIDKQPSPVVFFPPAMDRESRLNSMDFRPMPVIDEVEDGKEDTSPNPKDLSAQESVHSLQNEVSQPNVPLQPQVPATIVPAVKDNGKPKGSAPSTQTS